MMDKDEDIEFLAGEYAQCRDWDSLHGKRGFEIVYVEAAGHFKARIAELEAKLKTAKRDAVLELLSEPSVVADIDKHGEPVALSARGVEDYANTIGTKNEL